MINAGSVGRSVLGANDAPLQTSENTSRKERRAAATDLAISGYPKARVSRKTGNNPRGKPVCGTFDPTIPSQQCPDSDDYPKSVGDNAKGMRIRFERL